MKLTFVVEVEPFIPPLESSKKWAYRYYGGTIKQALEHRFASFRIGIYRGVKHER